MLCFLSLLSLFSWGRAASSEHAIAYAVLLFLSRTGMVSVGNLNESDKKLNYMYAKDYSMFILSYFGYFHVSYNPKPG